MFDVSNGFLLVHSGLRVQGSASPVKEELSTYNNKIRKIHKATNTNTIALSNLETVLFVSRLVCDHHLLRPLYRQ